MGNLYAITFLMKFGTALAAICAASVILGGAVAVAEGASWIILVACVAGGGLVYLLLRSYVELIRVISETLLPR